MDPGSLTGRPLLLLVTGGHSGRTRHGDVSAILAQVGAAVAAGIDLIQIRERALPDRVLLALVRRCVELARASRSVIVVNDRLDVALAAGAGGAQLRTDSLPAPMARRHVPAGFLLGRSVHDAAEAARVADSGGLDYLVLGTVFASRSKPGVSPCGVGVLAAAAKAVDLPVLAIGGVTVDRAVDVFRAGAAGVAAIDLFARPGPTGCFEGLGDVVVELRRAYRSAAGHPVWARAEARPD